MARVSPAVSDGPRDRDMTVKQHLFVSCGVGLRCHLFNFLLTAKSFFFPSWVVVGPLNASDTKADVEKPAGLQQLGRPVQA